MGSIIDSTRRLGHIRSMGMLSSAMEHGVPEMIYSTPTEPKEGLSAVKAIMIANQQGLKVYQINQTNAAAIVPILAVDPEVKTEITNAVAAGMEVTVPEANIVIGGIVGVGYIIVDPVTGSGAYRISGGLNGNIIEILGTVLDFSITGKQALLIGAGMEKLGIFKFFGILGTVIALELVFMDLWYNCHNLDVAMLTMAAFTVALVCGGIFVSAWVTAGLISPLWGIIAPYIIGELGNYLIKYVENTAPCLPPPKN